MKSKIIQVEGDNENLKKNEIENVGWCKAIQEFFIAL